MRQAALAGKGSPSGEGADEGAVTPMGADDAGPGDVGTES
jgi:hypothetical protein